jgi:hypothetical protein
MSAERNEYFKSLTKYHVTYKDTIKIGREENNILAAGEIDQEKPVQLIWLMMCIHPHLNLLHQVYSANYIETPLESKKYEVTLNRFDAVSNIVVTDIQILLLFLILQMITQSYVIVVFLIQK